MDVVVVLGTRPEAVKFAPLAQVMTDLDWSPRILFSGQHDRETMADLATELRLSVEFETYAGLAPQNEWHREFPWQVESSASDAELGVVVGDTDSSYLAASRFARARVPILHVEAGLRLSEVFEPEEANRRRITTLADWHLAPFDEQLLNCILDGATASKALASGDFTRLSLDYRLVELGWRLPRKRSDGQRYWIATIHRRSNRERVHSIAAFLGGLSKAIKAPIYLCRRNDTRLSALYEGAEQLDDVVLLDPLCPRQFVQLLAGAEGVVTDSAGVQQESTLGGLPTIVVRQGVELYGNSATLHCAYDLDVDAAAGFANSLGTRFWSYEPAPLDDRLALIATFLRKLG